VKDNLMLKGKAINNDTQILVYPEDKLPDNNSDFIKSFKENIVDDRQI